MVAGFTGTGGNLKSIDRGPSLLPAAVELDLETVDGFSLAEIEHDLERAVVFCLPKVEPELAGLADFFLSTLEPVLARGSVMNGII